MTDRTSDTGPAARDLSETVKAASRSMEEWLASSNRGDPEDRAAIRAWSSTLRGALAALSAPDPAPRETADGAEGALEAVDVLAQALTEAAPLRPGIHAEAVAILAALTDLGWSVVPAGPDDELCPCQTGTVAEHEAALRASEQETNDV